MLLSIVIAGLLLVLVMWCWLLVRVVRRRILWRLFVLLRRGVLLFWVFVMLLVLVLLVRRMLVFILMLVLRLGWLLLRLLLLRLLC